VSRSASKANGAVGADKAAKAAAKAAEKAALAALTAKVEEKIAKKAARARARPEAIRRLRLGDVLTLLHHRCPGGVLPDDDSGREYLHELLLPISLNPENAQRKMLNAIGLWAKWMKGDEAEELMDRVNLTPPRQRMPKARIVGDRNMVTNSEREFLQLRTIAPCDMTDKQIKEQRRAKDRARKRHHRKRQPRRVYLANNSITKTKPWAIKGESRATWYRNRAKERRALTVGLPEHHARLR
jgi:hypothetical protein